jgi:hypothetical protein
MKKSDKNILKITFYLKYIKFSDLNVNELIILFNLKLSILNIFTFAQIIIFKASMIICNVV